MKVIWEVEYCGDGDQACITKFQAFEDILKANRFYDFHAHRPGHTCTHPQAQIHVLVVRDDIKLPREGTRKSLRSRRLI